MLGLHTKVKERKEQMKFLLVVPICLVGFLVAYGSFKLAELDGLTTPYEVPEFEEKDYNNFWMEELENSKPITIYNPNDEISYEEARNLQLSKYKTIKVPNKDKSQTKRKSFVSTPVQRQSTNIDRLKQQLNRIDDQIKQLRVKYIENKNRLTVQIRDLNSGKAKSMVRKRSNGNLSAEARFKRRSQERSNVRIQRERAEKRLKQLNSAYSSNLSDLNKKKRKLQAAIRDARRAELKANRGY